MLFAVKQTWKCIFLTYRVWVQSILAVTTWRDLAAQPGVDTRSPDFFFFCPALCPWQHATSSNDNCSSVYGIRAGICGLFSFSINRISLSLNLWRAGGKGAIIPIVYEWAGSEVLNGLPESTLLANGELHLMCSVLTLECPDMALLSLWPCASMDSGMPCCCAKNPLLRRWSQRSLSKTAQPPRSQLPSNCQREPQEAEWWWVLQHWTLALGLEFALSPETLWAQRAYKTSCCILHRSRDWDWWCCGKATVWHRLNLSEHSRGFSSSSAAGIPSTGPHCCRKCHQSVTKYFLRQQCENSTRSPKWQVRQAAWYRGETGL